MSTRKSKGIEITLFFTAFIASTYGFGIYLFPAMVESVRTDIPFSYGTMGTISGFVQAGFMICALLAGFLTVRFGAMPMILSSIALCAIALGGLAITPNIIGMAVVLTVLGGCAAAIWVPMVEVAREHIAKEHQGKALGLMSSGTSYGVFVNSFLLTLLLPGYGWRSLWLSGMPHGGRTSPIRHLPASSVGKRYRAGRTNREEVRHGTRQNLAERANGGRSDHDVPQRFVLHALPNLPFGLSAERSGLHS